MTLSHAHGGTEIRDLDFAHTSCAVEIVLRRPRYRKHE